MRRPLIIVSVLLTAGIAVAKTAAKGKPSTAEVKPLMAQFLVNLQALQPYMASPQAFSSPKNEREIEKRLVSLAKSANSLSHFDAAKTPGFDISAGVLQDHVRQTSAAFRRGRTEYARWMLNETTQACIACHSQLPSGASGLVVSADQVKGTQLERADFLFATRQFDAALALYDELILQFRPSPQPGRLLTFETAETALRRELAILLRVRRSPDAALTTLERQQQNDQLPAALRDAMTAWMAELRKPGLVPAFDPKSVPAAELTAYAHRILGSDLKTPNLFSQPTKAASRLVLSGILYEVLQSGRTDLSTSEILFWLAKCDRELEQDFFLSMSDLYLQECVRRAPRTPIAKQCYREFEESITLQYTGSRGTDLPDDVQELLSDLRALTR